MAKIRTVKPDLARDYELAQCGALAKLVFIGLITNVADDEGRFLAAPRYIKGEAFPHDGITESQIGECLAILATANLVTLYKCDGKVYGYLNEWNRHQVIPPTRFLLSRLPAPPQTERKHGASKPHTPRIRSASRTRERKGVDRKDLINPLPPSEAETERGPMDDPDTRRRASMIVEWWLQAQGFPSVSGVTQRKLLAQSVSYAAMPLDDKELMDLFQRLWDTAPTKPYDLNYFAKASERLVSETLRDREPVMSGVLDG